LHEYDGDVLDACLIGLREERDAALGEAALIRITVRCRTDQARLCRAVVLARFRRRRGSAGAGRHKTVVPICGRICGAAKSGPRQGFRYHEKGRGLEPRAGG